LRTIRVVVFFTLVVRRLLRDCFLEGFFLEPDDDDDDELLDADKVHDESESDDDLASLSVRDDSDSSESESDELKNEKVVSSTVVDEALEILFKSLRKDNDDVDMDELSENESVSSCFFFRSPTWLLRPFLSLEPLPSPFLAVAAAD
jgi:hypothetical protein